MDTETKGSLITQIRQLLKVKDEIKIKYDNISKLEYVKLKAQELKVESELFNYIEAL